MKIRGSILLLAVLCGVQISTAQENTTVAPSQPVEDPALALGIAKKDVIQRTSKLDMYSCSDCHDSQETFNPTPRTLTEDHTNIPAFHPHNRVQEDSNYWCLACHADGDYDKLRLQSGRKVSMNSAYLVCGDCHGTQLRDWIANTHGKRVGNWNGPQKIYSCTECHDAHDPAFKPVKPMPPPTYPRGKTTAH